MGWTVFSDTNWIRTKDDLVHYLVDNLDATCSDIRHRVVGEILWISFKHRKESGEQADEVGAYQLRYYRAAAGEAAAWGWKGLSFREFFCCPDILLDGRVLDPTVYSKWLAERAEWKETQAAKRRQRRSLKSGDVLTYRGMRITLERQHGRGIWACRKEGDPQLYSLPSRTLTKILVSMDDSDGIGEGHDAAVVSTQATLFAEAA